MRRARFWTYCNGSPVRLTLRPGQTLRWHRYERHDEGWSTDSAEWTYHADSGTVRYDWLCDGTDCDGRLQTGATHRCPVDQLTARTVEAADVPLPEWTLEDRHRRDFQAEAAGY